MRRAELAEVRLLVLKFNDEKGLNRGVLKMFVNNLHK